MLPHHGTIGVLAGSKWMSLLDYERLDVQRIASWLRVEGRTCGVTSVGCGHGQLEALLVPLVGTVTGVDSFGSLCSEAKQVVRFVTISERRRVVEVQPDNVMLLVFPITFMPFDLYLRAYRGPRVVIIADDTCDPGPGRTALVCEEKKNESDQRSSTPVVASCILDFRG
eukprot:gene25252-10900_t